MQGIENVPTQVAAGGAVILSWGLLPPLLASIASAMAIVYYTILIYRQLRSK